MRANTVAGPKHYFRRLVGVFPATFNPRFRTTQDMGFQEHRLDHVPALMRQGARQLLYFYSNLNEPIGSVAAGVGLTAENARPHRWRDGEHSDAWTVDNNPDPQRTMWYPIIYEWYFNIVRNRIAIGQE